MFIYVQPHTDILAVAQPDRWNHASSHPKCHHYW